MSEIRIERAATLKPKPQDESKLAFGRTFTDHMLAVSYTSEKGWHDARIVPYAPIEMDPATVSLHYGQLIFEGMKAYRAPNGDTLMFRPEKNMQRMSRSAQRLCMPPVDEDMMVEAIAKLVEVEKDWIPTAPGTSLYIRPFMIATDAFLGVHPSDSYLLLVILSPVGPYYAEGLAPVKIFVEDEYVRAVKGGTGFCKCAGNYAAAMSGQIKAQKMGYSQVLWLDGVERKYIDEVGAMNVFFVVDGKVLTPETSGTILEGITRDSVLTMLRDLGVPVEERRITIDELVEAHEKGTLQEAFGAGTAAVISPIGELRYGERDMVIGGGNIGPISQRLYDGLTGIQTGKLEDKFGWVYKV